MTPLSSRIRPEPWDQARWQAEAAARPGLSVAQLARAVGKAHSTTRAANLRFGLGCVDGRAAHLHSFNLDPNVDRRRHHLRAMTAEQRRDYRILRRAGYRKGEALDELGVVVPEPSPLDFVHLTPCEARTLRAIMRGKGAPVTARAIRRATEGKSAHAPFTDVAIRARVSRLRRKVSGIVVIRRAYGKGYLAEPVTGTELPKMPYVRGLRRHGD